MGYWGHVDCKTWCHDTSSRISPLISKDLVHPVINFCFWRGKYFISCLLDSVIVKFNLIYSSHVQPWKGKNLSLIIFLFLPLSSVPRWNEKEREAERAITGLYEVYFFLILLRSMLTFLLSLWFFLIILILWFQNLGQTPFHLEFPLLLFHIVDVFELCISHKI